MLPTVSYFIRQPDPACASQYAGCSEARQRAAKRKEKKGVGAPKGHVARILHGDGQMSNPLNV